MAFSRGYKITMMALNQNRKENIEGDVVLNDLDVSDIFENYSDYPHNIQNEIDPKTDDEIPQTCSISQLFNENTLNTSDRALLDITNIPVVLLDNANDVFTDKELDSGHHQNLFNFSNFEEAPGNIDKPIHTDCKFVNYSSSSESESNSTEDIAKRRKIRRFSSEYSFHDEKDSDFYISSCSEKSGVVEDSVGISGMKKKDMPKRQKNKDQKALGATKSVQENPCRNKRCQNSCGSKFTEQQRHDIFEFYWGLGDHSKQKAWLLSCIRETAVKRQRVMENSRRTRSFKYFIKRNDEEIEVCQQFLLKTLNISQMTLRYTKNTALDGKIPKSDQRGKHDPPHKISLENKKQVHDFIKKLPAVPSHYCRSSSTKKYLPSEMRNVSFLYRIFVRDQLEFHKIKTQISLKVFRNIFKKDFNVGFHLPKKDKCITCESRNRDKESKSSAIEDLEYQIHLKDKEECKTQFLADQNIAKEDSSFICSSFDLQKVLNTPHGDNMLLYYSRKYSFYNETVYEIGTRNAYCYLWGETDGNRGTNEICSIIHKYLKEADSRSTVKSVALYCDSCAGQNKNKAMLVMLYTFLKESKNISHLKITFLLPGHTYMPVDSVHATIERFVRKRIIWAPSEWPTLIRNSRVDPQPYNVVSMSHTDFMSWKSFAEMLLPNKTTEGSKFQISRVRIAALDKGNDFIKIKYSYSDAAESLILPIATGSAKGKKSKFLSRKLSSVYPQPLEITQKKYKDLMKLCEKHVIPSKFINEYRQIAPNGNIPDILAQTDDEDEEN